MAYKNVFVWCLSFGCLFFLPLWTGLDYSTKKKSLLVRDIVKLVYCTLTVANVRDFKTARKWEKSFFFRTLLFLTLTSSNSKVYYAIALKFSFKQINLITKKSMSVICEIMNKNADFRIFVNASHSVFL